MGNGRNYSDCLCSLPHPSLHLQPHVSVLSCLIHALAVFQVKPRFPCCDFYSLLVLTHGSLCQVFSKTHQKCYHNTDASFLFMLLKYLIQCNLGLPSSVNYLSHQMMMIFFFLSRETVFFLIFKKEPLTENILCVANIQYWLTGLTYSLKRSTRKEVSVS